MAETVIYRLFNGALYPLPGVYMLDHVHTFAEFTVQHLVVGHVRGRFDTVTGEITVPEDPTKSSLKVTVETTSINTGNAKRDEDLRTERFFDVKQYLVMTYQCNKFTAELDGEFTAEGNLTIRNTTLPVPLKGRITGIIADPMHKIRIGIQTRAKTSRTDFELLTELEKENGGVALGNDILITINAEALLQQ
jgi:polyisoprenoid-binding protein YceI